MLVKISVFLKWKVSKLYMSGENIWFYYWMVYDSRYRLRCYVNVFIWIIYDYIFLFINGYFSS